MLWQKYLQRKAFPFAAETATDVLISHCKMCFVAHDRGENAGESGADWCLEAEPTPAEVDNWARMQLTVRRKQKKLANDMSPVTRSDRRTPTMRTRISDARVRAKSGSNRDKTPETRVSDLKDEIQVDDEEEKLRDARQAEEARRRERDNKVLANKKATEVEQQRVQALHEEMARRQHTFDSEGGLIWVEDLKLDRLPKTQEVFSYFVKRDPRAREQKEETGKGKDSPAGKKSQTQRSKRRFDRSSKGRMDEEDFPDGFSKLQHGQPPILETMVVKAGVVLDVYGKTKAGPQVAPTGGGMSRKEYVALTEKEVAYEAQFASTSAEGEADPNSPNVGPPGTAGSRSAAGASASGDGEGGVKLPDIADGSAGSLGGTTGSNRGLGRSGTSRGLGGPGGTSKPGEEGNKKGKSEGHQKDPPAPPMNARSKKMHAIGHLGQPPRLHVAPLGGPYGFGVAQPPLGATMGHGLVRHGSSKESYFFPHAAPEIPSLLKATSECAFGPKGRGTLRTSPRTPRGSSLAALPLSGGRSREERSQTAPSKSQELETGALVDEESPRHGMIRAEKKSQAYRGMRQTLFPNTLSSGYVSGML